jgi:acetylglutamate kinase
LISSLTISQAEALIHDGTVSGGMIPKVKTCIDAVQGGAEGAVIMDGRAPHALLVELFTEHGMGNHDHRLINIFLIRKNDNHYDRCFSNPIDR